MVLLTFLACAGSERPGKSGDDSGAPVETWRSGDVEDVADGYIFDRDSDHCMFGARGAANRSGTFALVASSDCGDEDPTPNKVAWIFSYAVDGTSEAGDSALAWEIGLFEDIDGVGDLAADSYADFAALRGDDIVLLQIAGAAVDVTEILGPTMLTLSGVGDTDGDGLDDLALSEADSSAVWLLPGPLGSRSDAAIEGIQLLMPETSYSLVAPAGDTDGDGLPEVLVSQPEGSAAAGSVYLLDEPAFRAGAASSALATLRGPRPEDRIRAPRARGDDFDGDGRQDILLSADLGTGGETETAGAVYLVRSPVEGEIGVGEAGLTIRGTAGGERFGLEVTSPGDADGDGHADLLATQLDPDNDNKRTYLMFGPFSSPIDLETWPRVVLWAERRNHLASALLGLGDQNEDGLDDFLIAVPGVEREWVTGEESEGFATIFFGKPR